MVILDRSMPKLPEVMSIVAISALADNYIWAIIHHPTAQVIVIDPGEASVVVDFLQKRALTLCAIWITHHHDDHIGGVARLMDEYPSTKLYAHKDHHLTHLSPILVDETDTKDLDAFGWSVAVWRTFGHTKSHLSYVLYAKGAHVFCADTMFRAGCGRVFCGTIEELYQSFLRFDELDGEVIFYPAHEYTLSNLKFAQALEPSNNAITTALTNDKNRRLHDLPTVPTTLSDERQINPFLRALSAKEDDELWVNAAKQSKKSIKNNQTLFSVLRMLKNQY